MGAGTRALPLLPEGAARKAARAPGWGCQGRVCGLMATKGLTGQGVFVGVWERRDWKEAPEGRLGGLAHAGLGMGRSFQGLDIKKGA